jgi:hypothetical protein
MIDYFFKWNTSSDARADAFAAAQKFGGLFNSSQGSTTTVWAWAQDHVLPNVQAWRPSQDSTTISVSTFDGSTIRTIAHNYLAGWFAIVATNQPVTVLTNSTALAFALRREWTPKIVSTADGSTTPSNLIVKNNIGAVITDVGVSPVFAGSNYPIGGFST